MKILTTFSGGSYSLKLSQMNLEANAKQYFDGVASFDETHPLIVQFMKEHADIFQYRRGFGFWSWKPFIIYTTLQNVNEGDYVFYADSGDEFIDDPAPLFDICNRNGGILLFENRSGNPHNQIWKNKFWVKRDAYLKMDCTASSYVEGNQVVGGEQLYQKNENSMKFVEKYLAYCCDFDIISDSRSKSASELSTFIDNRHDQSVLSLLSIKEKIRVYPEISEAGNATRLPYDPYAQIIQRHRGSKFGRQ